MLVALCHIKVSEVSIILFAVYASVCAAILYVTTADIIGSHVRRTAIGVEVCLDMSLQALLDSTEPAQLTSARVRAPFLLAAVPHK